MGKFTCDLCQCTLDDYKSHRQHRIEHIKQRDWINSANATNKREIYRDGSHATTTSSVHNSPASNQTSPSIVSSEPEMEEVAASISDQKTPSRTTQRDRFKCDFCNYHGKREGLVQHVKAIHQEKYEKWRQKQSPILQVRCNSCEWFFASLDDLSSHQRTAHPIKRAYTMPVELPVTTTSVSTTSDEAASFKQPKKKLRTSLLQLCSETKHQAQRELKEEEEEKKMKKEPEPKKLVDKIPPGPMLPDEPPSCKNEAYFVGNQTKCPFFADSSRPCEYDAKSPQLLECHVSRSHTAKWDYFMRSLDRPYECEVCNWRYSTLAALKKHKLKYAKICGAFPIQLSEEYLNRVSRDLLFIESDPDQVTPSDPTRGFIVDDVIRADETKCPYQRFYHCRFNFQNNLALEGHVSTYHRDKYDEFMTIVDRPLKCETCFFRYDDLNRLRLHKRQHEGVCESYDLSNEEQYYRTQQFVYKTNKKVRLKVMSSVLTCSHCDAKFDLEQDAAAPFKLVQHVAHHHPSHFITFRTTPSSLLPYQCSVCSFCFVDQSSLLDHKCASLIRYVCCICALPLCHTNLKRLAKCVKTHFDEAHPHSFSILRTTKSNVYSHGCPSCGLYFTTSAQLEKHKLKAKC